MAIWASSRRPALFLLAVLAMTVPHGTDFAAALRRLRIEAGADSPGYPKPGFWMLRAVKGGPEVPARIYLCDHEPGVPDNKLDRWPPFYLVAEIAGREVEWDRVWLVRRRPITAEEYDHQMRIVAWAEEHAPREPEANPFRRVNLNQIEPVF